ncbi:MAG: formate--tetrahydrofolate ligase [Planctomyces sp.]|nr:formate--tetrahydrofolate ligase [Planctomyces sp.]
MHPRLRRIDELTSRLGLSPDDVEPRGWHVGKFSQGLHQRLGHRPRGKYVNVAAINPTPLGEGKTVTAIGLAMGLERIGRRAIVTLRQPSMGPLFGVKGGGAGGGQARLEPFDDVNLHLTGDLHAVAAANNLLAALVDNHAARGMSPAIDPDRIDWKRCVDVCDRSLRGIRTGVGDDAWIERQSGFDLTAASEIMAILGLAVDLTDLKDRLGRIVVGRTTDGTRVTAAGLRAAGALTAILRDALRPNLVQTSDGTPALVHTGPFANIAHGNSSVVADLAALRLAEFVVTESGFGADCGAEKFFHLKCRASGLAPDLEVLVCTARALKLHSGKFTVRPGRPLPRELLQEDLDALHAGAANLEAHLEILRRFGVPTVVAVNRFPDDPQAEIDAISAIARSAGADDVAVTTAFLEGAAGSEILAEAVVRAASLPVRFEPLYSDDLPLVGKLEAIVRQVYGGDGVDLSPNAQRELDDLQGSGFGRLPVCVAKTQYSLSHDPELLGRPRGFRLPVDSVRLAAGAGYVYVLAGQIRTMPGLPSEPLALRIDVDGDGRIQNLA